MIMPISHSLQIQLQCPCCPCVKKLYQEFSQCILKIIKKITEFFSNLCHFKRKTVPTIPRPVTPMPSNGPKNLLPFFRGQETNNNGITLQNILQATDNWLEMDHKWVQWAFPLEKASA